MYSVHSELFWLCAHQPWALAHRLQEHHSSFALERLPVSQGQNASAVLSFPCRGWSVKLGKISWTLQKTEALCGRMQRVNGLGADLSRPQCLGDSQFLLLAIVPFFWSALSHFFRVCELPSNLPRMSHFAYVTQSWHLLLTTGKILKECFCGSWADERKNGIRQSESKNAPSPRWSQKTDVFDLEWDMDDLYDMRRPSKRREPLGWPGFRCHSPESPGLGGSHVLLACQIQKSEMKKVKKTKKQKTNTQS